MFLNKIYKRIISICCLSVIFLSILPAEVMLSAEASAKTTSVNLTPSQLINGSPLLSDSAEEYSPEDAFAFGMYLSTICIPYRDNLSTAFNESESLGSAGDKVEFLKFQVGGNAEDLIKLANCCASYQFNGILDDQGMVKSDYVLVPGSQIPALANSTTSAQNKWYIKYTEEEKENSSETPGYIPVLNEDGYTLMLIMLQGWALWDSTLPDTLFMDNFGNVCVKYLQTPKGLPQFVIALPASMNSEAFSKIQLLNPTIITSKSKKMITMRCTRGAKIVSQAKSFTLAPTGAWRRAVLNFRLKEFASSDTVQHLDTLKLNKDGTLRVQDQYLDIQGGKTSSKEIFKISPGGFFGTGDSTVTFNNAFWSNEYGSAVLRNQLYFLNQLAMIKNVDGLGFNVKASFKKKFVDGLSGEVLTTNFGNALVSREEKTNSIRDIIFNILTKPAVWIAEVLASLFNLIWRGWYNILSDYKLQAAGETAPVLGFNQVKEFPWIGHQYNEWTSFHSLLIIVAILIFISVLGVISNRRTAVQSFLLSISVLLIFIFLSTILDFVSNATESALFMAYNKRQPTWLLDYNINFQKNYNLASTQAALIARSNSDYDSGFSLRFRQDKSPIVVSNASEQTQDLLANSGFGYLFLGSILKQYRKGDNISSNIEELFKRLTMLNFIWTDSASDNVNVENNALNDLFKSKINIAEIDPNGSSSVGYDKAGLVRFYSDYKDGVSAYASQTKTEIYLHEAFVTDSNNQTTRMFAAADDVDSDRELGETHQCFYILPEVQVSGTQADVNQLVNNVYNKYFTDNDTLSEVSINKFNFIDSLTKYDQGYGYFILTENVIPYFYTVYHDLFKWCENKMEIADAIQGSVCYQGYENLYNSSIYDSDQVASVGGTNTGFDIAENVVLKPVTVERTNSRGEKYNEILRKSLLVQDSYIKDFVDLSELFNNVIPYCYAVSNTGRTAFGNELIGDKYKLYKDNPAYWIFDCNWAVKLYDAFYNSSALSSIKFSPGAGIRFCEYDILNGAGGNPNTTPFENLCLTFYEELLPQIESLIDYYKDNRVSKSVMLRQMAILTGLQFNRTFSTTLLGNYPDKVELGSVSVDLFLKDMLRANGYQVDMTKSAIDNLLDGTPITLSAVPFCIIITVIFALGLFKLFWSTFFLCLCIFSLVRVYFIKDGKPVNTLLGCFFSWIIFNALYTLPIIAMCMFADESLPISSLPVIAKSILLLFILTAMTLFGLGRLSKVLIESTFNGSADLGFSRYGEFASDTFNNLRTAPFRTLGKLAKAGLGAGVYLHAQHQAERRHQQPLRAMRGEPEPETMKEKTGKVDKSVVKSIGKYISAKGKSVQLAVRDSSVGRVVYEIGQKAGNSSFAKVVNKIGSGYNKAKQFVSGVPGNIERIADAAAEDQRKYNHQREKKIENWKEQFKNKYKPT